MIRRKPGHTGLLRRAQPPCVVTCWHDFALSLPPRSFIFL